ncbi:MAG: VIT1/CCC1 transporter family protein [Candidatus Bathyarchaeia archaeon]
MLDEEIRRRILSFQRNEITEHIVYNKLAQKMEGGNAEVLRRISKDELRHYNEWKEYTRAEAQPDRWTIWKILTISKIFGLTFAIKLMEGGEKGAEEAYHDLSRAVPKAEEILREETEHEKLLIEMIDEEMIGYIGSMVLGLNDALVELTGALAGLTFTLQNTRLIGTAGLITGIAASLSMSASEYLSQKSERGSKSPIKASFYTGIAYISTVLLLVTPYFVFADYYVALGVTVLGGVLIIFFFTFFISVVKELSFRKIFLEILFISLGVAAVSFIIGWIAKGALGVEM